jgi:hypothetical protein
MICWLYSLGLVLIQKNCIFVFLCSIDVLLFHSRDVTVTLLDSITSGRKQIFLDGKKVHEEKIPKNQTTWEHNIVQGNFTLSVKINGNNDDSNNQPRYDLSINKVPYRQLRRGSVFQQGSAPPPPPPGSMLTRFNEEQRNGRNGRSNSSSSRRTEEERVPSSNKAVLSQSDSMGSGESGESGGGGGSSSSGKSRRSSKSKSKRSPSQTSNESIKRRDTVESFDPFLESSNATASSDGFGDGFDDGFGGFDDGFGAAMQQPQSQQQPQQQPQQPAVDNNPFSFA